MVHAIPRTVDRNKLGRVRRSKRRVIRHRAVRDAAVTGEMLGILAQLDDLLARGILKPQPVHHDMRTANGESRGPREDHLARCLCFDRHRFRRSAFRVDFQMRIGPGPVFQNERIARFHVWCRCVKRRSIRDGDVSGQSGKSEGKGDEDGAHRRVSEAAVISQQAQSDEWRTKIGLLIDR